MMTSSTIHIRAVTSPTELTAARGIIAEYIASISSVAGASFAHQNVERELADLPGVYVPPRGGLWLAWRDGDAAPVGCIALRPLVSHLPSERTRGIGEIKRMYTRPSARGLGVARQMCEVVMAAGREAGYEKLWLDSDTELHAALKLYQSLGFVEVERFNLDPDPKTVYLGRDI
jgi:GNAT superfamily N-acetyltransferase